MPQTPTPARRGKSYRPGRGLKITSAILLAFLVLIVLNALALDNESEPAALTIDGAQLVNTTSGSLQVVDTTAPTSAEASLQSLPIVLVHGSGSAINWWDELIPLLSPSHRVVAIDMLGYGGSAKPKSGYSIETQASLVAQVLAKLGIERTVAVGHSLGGEVVTSLAEQAPDLVAGVTLIDMAPDDSSYGGLGGAAKASQWPMLGQAFWRIAPDFVIRRNISRAFAPGYNVSDKYVDDVKAMTYPAFNGSYTASADFTDAVPLDQRLQKIAVPLLVIFGEEDQIFSARESISAFAAIPGVETLLIPGVGHSPQVEAPEKTAAAIRRFATSLAPEPEPAPKPAPKPNLNQNSKQDKQKAGQKQKKQGAKKNQSAGKQNGQ